MGMGEKIQPTKSWEQQSRGTIALLNSLGELWTTLGTKGCGTSVREHQLYLHGSFWMRLHPPPASNHPTATAAQLLLSSSPPKMFPSLALSVPKAGVWSLSGRRSPELVATRSASRPPIRFHCVPLRRNVPVPFPRQLLGKDSHDGPHQEGLSQLPRP